MTTLAIRQKLHNYIDTIEDNKAEVILDLIENDFDSNDGRKKIILLERENYLKGNIKTNSWEVVKEMAMDKKSIRL